MIFRNKKILSRILLINILIYTSCNDDTKSDVSFEDDLQTDVIAPDVKETIVYVSVDNVEIPVYLSIPEGFESKPLPAVVVMHGSYGMWSQNNPGSKIMSGQFKEWKDLLAQNDIVGAFVDSYTPRGVTTRTGKWRELPENIRISAQFVRPKDANAVLDLLQHLKYDSGNSVVQEENIALLGFSDGASAVLATLIDTKRVPQDFEWTQSTDKKTYDTTDGVLAPQPKPKVPYAGAVYYYGGAVGYNYFGKHPCGSEALEGNVFYPYAPMLFQIPSNDVLSENTLCLVDNLKKKGAPVEIAYYEGMEHGFDYDGSEMSTVAREKTIGWLKELFETN